MALSARRLTMVNSSRGETKHASASCRSVVRYVGAAGIRMYTAKGTNAADIFLRANGITNTIDRQTIIAANYDVQVTVASALRISC